MYDEDEAKEELKKKLEEYYCLEEVLQNNRYDFETDEDKLNEFFEDVFEDFSQVTGIGSKGYDAISEYIEDAFKFASDLGKKDTGILDLYMLAFKLAKEKLRERDLM